MQKQCKMLFLFFLLTFVAPLSAFGLQWDTWFESPGGVVLNYDSITSTEDRGFAIGGQISTGGFSYAGLVFKLDANGNIMWQKTLSTPFSEIHSIKQTPDRGYIILSQGGGVAKLDFQGDIQWQKVYSGISGRRDIEQTSDGGYIFIGTTVEGTPYVGAVKIDANGNVQWTKAYGSSSTTGGQAIRQTSDGGYVLTGYTYAGAGQDDIFVLKLNASGDIQWQKTYGGPGSEDLLSINQTSDGGYIIGGWTSSFGAGRFDYWVLKLDGNGSIQWQKTYGGALDDVAYSIQQTVDGGYIVAGPTGDMTYTNYSDIMVLKLDSYGNIQWQKSYLVGAGYNFPYIHQTDDGGHVIGSTYGNCPNCGIWVLKLDGNGAISPDCPWVGITNAVTMNTFVGANNITMNVTQPSMTATASTATVADANLTQYWGCYSATSFADLIVPSVDGPTSGALGATIPVTYTVQNIGGAYSMQNGDIDIYLSLDSTITIGDILLGSDSLPEIAPWAAVTQTTSVRIPKKIATGYYYVGVIADPNNREAESDENNNTGYDPIPINVTQ